MHKAPNGVEQTTMSAAGWEQAWLEQALHADPSPRAAQPMFFRIVEARGNCMLGRRVGEMIALKPGEAITPRVCPYAENILRMAATEDEIAGVAEWCCPVNDHLLVFRREVAIR